MNETADFSLFPGSHRLAELARRVPRAAWPFIVLAAAEFLLYVGPGPLDTGRGSLDLRMAVILILPTLLPVAVLFGRRDAWTSARVIMIGAIIWGPVAGFVTLVGVSNARFIADPGTDSAIDFGLRVISRLASLLALAAPAVIAYGLRGRRKTQTSWPKVLVAGAVVGVASLCVLNVKQALDSQALINYFGYYIDSSLRDRLDAIAQGFEPLGLLAVGALAWSSVSAVRAQEAPRRFWLAMSAGSSLLLATALYSRLGLMSESLWTLLNLAYGILILAAIAGFTLLLIGFGIGLPDSDEDLLGDVLPVSTQPRLREL
jgi:hypothetical protein